MISPGTFNLVRARFSVKFIHLALLFGSADGGGMLGPDEMLPSQPAWGEAGICPVSPQASLSARDGSSLCCCIQEKATFHITTSYINITYLFIRSSCCRLLQVRIECVCNVWVLWEIFSPKVIQLLAYIHKYYNFVCICMSGV